jgi:hypothetical protein
MSRTGFAGKSAANAVIDASAATAIEDRKRRSGWLMAKSR